MNNMSDKLMGNSITPETFVEQTFAIKVKTALRLQEIQESINEDDEGLFEYLLSGKVPISNISHSTDTEKTNPVSEMKDEDILNDFYQQDLNAGRIRPR